MIGSADTKTGPIARRRRVLFVAEAVTLAHFARCVALAQMLDSKYYDVFLASDPRYLSLLPESRQFVFHRIKSIPSSQFTLALEKGRPVYDAETLTDYVNDDLNLLNEIQPDLVIGDFRLSLAVSAPSTETPYASIINAYWSPYARVLYPVPDLPFARILGVNVAQRLFNLVRPIAFGLHARPLNQVRNRFGLPSLGNDLRQVYSWADHVLYPDIPKGFDMAPLPPNHHFIGPVVWSAPTETPNWWSEIPADRPVIYVSLGSSGQGKLVPTVLEAFADLPVSLIVSTVGNVDIPQPPTNVYLAEFLPGSQATERADLVICNGGNLTTYQAMFLGVPAIGIVSNMDQMLNMQMVERLGVGMSIRAAEMTGAKLRSGFEALVEDKQPGAYSASSAQQLSKIHTDVLMRNVLDGIFS